MRETYLVYPEAIRKLTEAGLVKRIDDASEGEDYPSLTGVFFEDDLRGVIAEMKEREYYGKKAGEAYKSFAAKLNPFITKPENHFWSIQCNGAKQTEEAEIEDFRIMGGFLASFILNPAEFWSPEKFGFSSVYDLVGCIGAYMVQKTHSSFYEGYAWETHTPDREHFVTEITGDGNGDLRLFRTDKTPYPTTDPLKNPVLYRPKLNRDLQYVSGYHSTEPRLLIAALKFLEQQGMINEFIEDRGKNFLERMRGLTRHPDDSGDDANESLREARKNFINYSIPLPHLDKNNRTNQFTFDRLGTTGEGTYGIYLDNEGNLAFAYESNPNSPQKNINLTIPRNEVHHLVEGVFVQSSKHMGRTPIKQLENIIRFRFSEQFDKMKTPASKV